MDEPQGGIGDDPQAAAIQREGARFPLKQLTIASTSCFALALLPWPYAYYTLLRWLVSATAVVGLLVARERRSATWPWIYGGIAVLYNPIAPIYLGSKMLWATVNALTCAAMWTGVSLDRREA